jgi:hypothetical protein
MLGLVDRAIVYTENPTTGIYDVALFQNVRCRLEHIGGGNSVAERAEFSEMRHLVFEISYDMPEDCEILIAGTRYNPVAGTFARLRGTNSRKIVKSCDVQEVKH